MEKTLSGWGESRQRNQDGEKIQKEKKGEWKQEEEEERTSWTLEWPGANHSFVERFSTLIVNEGQISMWFSHVLSNKS